MTAGSAPFSVTAQALHDDIRHTRKLSLGCAVLDRVMGGGIDVQGITEVAGSAGAGKTQLVLRCLLHAQLPPSEGGLSGGSDYKCGFGNAGRSEAWKIAEEARGGTSRVAATIAASYDSEHPMSIIPILKLSNPTFVVFMELIDIRTANLSD